MNELNLKNLLTKYAKENGLTQKALAKQLDMSPQNFNNKLNGDRELSFKEAHDIARLLNVPMEILWCICS